MNIKNTNVIVRRANAKDIDSLVRLWKEFMKVHDADVIAKNSKLKPHLKLNKDAHLGFKKWTGQLIKSKNGLITIVEVDGKAVGYTLCLIKKNIPVFALKKLGYISDMYVKKEYQGLGISSKLKDDAIKWFKKKKIKHISLRVYYDNEHGRKVYEKWGFFNHSIEMCREI